MKILFDLIPIALFFGTYRYGNANPDWAAGFATEWLGFVVAGGVVNAKIAPILLATVVMILATFAQVTVLKVLRKKVDKMLWFTLALGTVLGGATVYFQSEAFIKWKPTALYWLTSIGLFLNEKVRKENAFKAMLGEQMKLPEAIWQRVNLSAILFFLVLGVVNIWVAYNFDTSTWVNFKFACVGITFVFMIVGIFYMVKHDETEAISE